MTSPTFPLRAAGQQLDEIQKQNLTPEFIDFIKRVEGSGGVTSRGTFIPFDSIEGGAQTVGFGHKLQPGESFGELTQEQAEDLLRQDLTRFELFARNAINRKFGEGRFENLPQNHRQALIDFAFNLGPGFVDEFPKFTNALVSGDLDTARRESKRFFHQGDQVVELEHRNKALLAELLST